MAKHHLAAHASGRELDPGERIDRYGVGRERPDVAQGNIGVRRLEQRGEGSADRGQVDTGNRPGDGKDDSGRPRGRHL